MDVVSLSYNSFLDFIPIFMIGCSKTLVNDRQYIYIENKSQVHDYCNVTSPYTIMN